MARSKTKNPPPLALVGALNVQGSVTMRTLVLEHAQKPASAITIDLAQVASCDTAGLQLLSSARQSALSAGRTWRLINPSAAVLHTCAEAALKPEQLGL